MDEIADYCAQPVDQRPAESNIDRRHCQGFVPTDDAISIADYDPISMESAFTT